MPVCPSPYVYMDGPGGIYAYDPTQALSASNPFSIGIPNGGGGLTLMPNINGGTLSPTFYSVIGGNYAFWNGTSWQNTGHSTGNGAAVNLGGCNSAIYNLVGASGQVYVYNGTGTGSLLTTISGFSGGGPYDLVTDCFCNFYVLKTTTPNQNLTLYSPAGVALCTYSLNNLPSATAGGGFAIINNQIFLKNNLTNGFFVGTISGSSITFTNLIGFSLNPGDFASCPVCIPSATLNNAYLSGGALGCLVPTINVIANTTATPVNYVWSGPGIVGPNTNSAIVVNSTGIYTCVISANGCPASQLTLTTTIISSVIPVFAAITPSGNICLNSGTQLPLIVSSSANNSTTVWGGSGLPGPVPGPSVMASMQGVYSVTVTDMFTGCAGAASVNIITNPTVNLAISSNSICAQSILGSPATLTLTPSGANSYTLITSPQFTTSSPNGTLMPAAPVPPFSSGTVIASATLAGANSICHDSTSLSFLIMPNPTVLISPQNPSICAGGSVALMVSGAWQYSWMPVPGLNSYTSSLVMASPANSSTYTVVGNNGNCFANPVSIPVNVQALPVFSVSPSNSLICLGGQASFSTVGNAQSYSWSPSNGLSSTTSNTVIASPASNMVYQVVGTLNTCTSTSSATLFVMTPPTMSLSLGQNSICASNFSGSTNTVLAVPAGAITYTLLSGNNYAVNTPNGPAMVITTAGPSPLVPTVITLSLTGSSGVCQMSSTHTLLVVPNPTVTVVPSNTNICPGKSQIITAQGADTYTWGPLSNLNTYTGNVVISVTPSVTSLYSVIGSSMSCLSNPKNAMVNILPIPIVNVNPVSSTVCIGNSVTLTANGNAQLYFWSPGTGLSSTTGSVVSSSPTTLTSYTITGSLNSCTNTAVATVSAIAVPIVSASASEYTICAGAPTELNASGAISYNWLPVAAVTPPVGASVSVSPLVNTIYTVNGFNGQCTGVSTVQIHTIPRPNMTITAPYNQVCIGYSLPISVSGAQYYNWSPIAGLSSATGSLVHASPQVNTNYTIMGINASGTLLCTQVMAYSVMVTPNVVAQTSGEAVLCLGEKTTISASGGNTYLWAPPEGLSAVNLPAVVASPSVSTVYTVQVSNNTFCGNSATLMVVVNPRPKVFAGRDTVYNLDEPVMLSASGTGTISWISGENVECPSCWVSRVYPGGNECYVAQTLNEYGCAAQDMVCIEITNEFYVYIPNTFTPNNDGLNDVFYVVGSGISDFSMEIFNRWGQMVFRSTEQARGWDGHFKGDLAESAIYTYRVAYKGLNGKRYEKSGSVYLSR